MHTWFHLIERAIPGTGKLVVAKKVTADMIIMAPAMALGFFTVTKSMEGERLSDAFDIAKAKLEPTLTMNYKVWPLANVLVFTVVPFQYRTPFVNCVSLGWSTFLSGMASKVSKDHEVAVDAMALEGFGALDSHGVVNVGDAGLRTRLELLRDPIPHSEQRGRRDHFGQQRSFMQPEVIKLTNSTHCVCKGARRRVRASRKPVTGRRNGNVLSE
eukprot:jgi/Phyca11/112647/e_gw1.22.449.1